MTTFTTTYTSKDIAAFLARPKKKTFFDWIMMYFAVLMLINFIASGMQMDVISTIFFGLMFLFFALPKVRNALIGKTRYEVMKNHAQNVKFSINEKEVKMVTSMGSATYPWTSISKAEATAEYLFLVLLGTQGLIIPRREFKSDKTWNELVALAKKQVKATPHQALPKQTYFNAFFLIMALFITYSSFWPLMYIVFQIMTFIFRMK
jgi:hypothetical protein